MNDPFLYVGILLATLAVLFVAVLLLSHLQTKRFKTVRINARPDGIKAAPKRICLISDLHFPMFYLNAADVVDTIAKTPCDAIMIAGDLSHNDKGLPRLKTFLSLLSEKTEAPVYIVLGNHDICREGKTSDVAKRKKYVEMLNSTEKNIKVLENCVEVLKISGADSKIVIAGMSDYRYTSKLTLSNVYEEALSAADENDTLLILEHNPDVVTALDEKLKASKRDNLILSGHTHGGQFWLPFNLEFKLLRKDILPKKGFVYGLYDWNENTKLYISCGLGESFLPIRLMTTPEIVFIDY